MIIFRFLDSRFVNHAQNQRNEVHDKPVEDRSKAHLEATGDDVGCYVVMSGQEICHLKETGEYPPEVLSPRKMVPDHKGR